MVLVGEHESMLTRSSASTLRLVHSAPAEPVETVWFCGRCACSTASEAVPAPVARVCQRCGLGLLLETRADVCPEPGDAFLIVDSNLTVQALSSGAERVLG